MDKNKALTEINKIIMKVKVMDGFKGRAGLLKKLSILYDMVDTHTPVFKYDGLCADEAKRIYDEVIAGIIENVSVGQKD